MTNDLHVQIAELNIKVLTRIGPSSIHGVGVIALKDIPAGTRMYLDEQIRIYSVPYERFNELRQEARSILLERWPSIVVGGRFAWPDCRQVAYMNHDNAPNYDAAADTTLKDIKKGEELTEDYRKIKGWDTVFPWLVDKPIDNSLDNKKPKKIIKGK